MMKNNRNSVAAYMFALALFALAASAAFPGCPSKTTSGQGTSTVGTSGGTTGGDETGTVTGQTGGETTTSTGSVHGLITLTLYFPDDQVMYLHPEKRVVPGTATPAREMVRQLLKGPRTKGLISAIPAGTELLDIDIKGGVAYVDFSRDLVRNAPGGSAGEAMTIYSVVNSLTTFPAVKKVKFLVEGRPVDTLAGHADLSEPIGRNKKLNK